MAISQRHNTVHHHRFFTFVHPPLPWNTQHKVLICQELRSSLVRQALVQEAAKHFSQVTKLPDTALPAGVRAEHLELFELRL